MASTSGLIFGLLRSLADTIFKSGKSSSPPRTQTSTKPSGRATTRPTGRTTQSGPTAGLSAPYPGDFQGTSTVSYAPKPDGAPDPGEIVWTWVPYEEDYSQGKDRPVLIVGRSGKRLLALMLTSKDHTGEPRGNDYVDIGSGSWDPKGRPSEVKLDRVLQVAPADLRREGAVLEAKPFKLVADGLRKQHGWK